MKMLSRFAATLRGVTLWEGVFFITLGPLALVLLGGAYVSKLFYEFIALWCYVLVNEEYNID